MALPFLGVAVFPYLGEAGIVLVAAVAHMIQIKFSA